MSYCGGLQYYCKLGATSQAVHICYVSRHTQHTNLDSNSVSFDVTAGQVLSGGRGKHPVHKTVRKKKSEKSPWLHQLSEERNR
uniref:Uncharacterized protein n=1 Tax=Strix occidentalis caurina TaxID=311401 RepID=A0A8D0KU24_STROC